MVDMEGVVEDFGVRGGGCQMERVVNVGDLLEVESSVYLILKVKGEMNHLGQE